MEIAFRTERSVCIIVDGRISGVSVRRGSTVAPVSFLLYYYICTCIYMYKIFFRKCCFVSLPAGRTNSKRKHVLDHWPMPRDEHSAHPVATYATRVMRRGCRCA